MLAASGLAASPLAAQEQALRDRVQAVQITDLSGYLDFTLRSRERTQRSKVGAGDTEASELIMEESLKLQLDGSIYHPNFIEFTVGGVFGLQQASYEDNFGGRYRSSSDDGTILEFDLSARFFKKKSYPGSVFARRYRALEPRPFQPSIETNTTTYGLVWQYISETMPTSVQFSHTTVDLHPLSDLEEDSRNEDTLFRFETAYRFNDHNVLSFLFNRQSVKEEPFQLEYDLDEYTVGHRLDFGQRHQYRLESELNYYDQVGTFDIERIRWREVLRMEFRENLRSFLVFEALDRTQGTLADVPPLEEESLYFSGTLEHELYDSLTTQLFGFVQQQEFNQGLEIDRLGGQLSLDYRKTNRWGTLRAGYRFRAQTEERRGGDVRSEVLDERHVFRDPEPAVLANTNVDTGTITVTSEDGLTFYVVGRDFSVRRIGDQIELERIPTGLILDGQTVLVDYVFDIGGDFTLDTIGHDFTLRQDFDFGLSPYYRLRWQDQTISPQDATGAVPEDITAHILGLEYRWKRLRLMAEYEDHESTIDPYDAIRLSADYTHRFKFGATGVLKARWSDFNYQPPVERQTQFFTTEGRYRHPITSNLTFEGVVLYRTEEDSLSGDDEGIDVELTLEWLVRQTEVRVTYETGMFEDDFADSDYQALFLQVRRSF